VAYIPWNETAMKHGTSRSRANVRMLGMWRMGDELSALSCQLSEQQRNRERSRTSAES
jgi:hypothetical protein